MLASSPVGTLWGTPVVAHGAITIDQIQWPRNKPGERGSTYLITSIDGTSGTVTPQFSSPLSLRPGLNNTLVLDKDQRAAFGGISDKDVSGNLLLVEPE